MQLLAANTADSTSVERHGQWVVKRVDRADWQRRWDVGLDAQMAARVAESRRWPLVVPHFWIPRHDVVVRPYVAGRMATIEECKAYLRMCLLQGRLEYLRDVRRWNLIVDRWGLVWLIDFWIDLTEWVA